LVEIKLQVERLEAIRLAESAKEDTTANYTINVSLSERERTPSAISLNFDLALECQPQLAKISIRGFTTVKGSREEIQSVLRPADPNSPPLILVTVYERIYGFIYLVARDLNLPHPMPGLLRQGET
jgi:hypothetical protein